MGVRTSLIVAVYKTLAFGRESGYARLPPVRHAVETIVHKQFAGSPMTVNSTAKQLTLGLPETSMALFQSPARYLQNLGTHQILVSYSDYFIAECGLEQD